MTGSAPPGGSLAPPDGTDVLVRRRSGGRPPRLLLLHGLASAETLWDPCLDLLAPDREVWTAQLPWRGEGTEWGRRPDPGESLRQALDEMPGGPRVVVAHSMSATLLLEVLHRAAAAGADPFDAWDIKALVLVSPFYRASPEAFDWDTISHYLNDFHLIMEEGIRVHSGGRFPPGIQRAMAERVRDTVGPYGWLRFFDLYLRTPELRPALITVPCLVIAGRNDIAAPPGESEALAAALPTARLHLLPGSGHFPMIEEPGVFAARVRSFLASPALSTLESHR